MLHWPAPSPGPPARLTVILHSVPLRSLSSSFRARLTSPRRLTLVTRPRRHFRGTIGGNASRHVSQSTNSLGPPVLTHNLDACSRKLRRHLALTLSPPAPPVIEKCYTYRPRGHVNALFSLSLPLPPLSLSFIFSLPLSNFSRHEIGMTITTTALLRKLATSRLIARAFIDTIRSCLLMVADDPRDR